MRGATIGRPLIVVLTAVSAAFSSFSACGEFESINKSSNASRGADGSFVRDSGVATDAGMETDNPADDSGVRPARVSVYQLQNPQAQPHPASGTPVELYDVVVASPVARSGGTENEGLFFVMEKAGGPYSGIMVRMKGIPAGGEPEAGSAMRVTGVYMEEIADTATAPLSVIEASGVDFLYQGSLPAPVKISDPGTIASAGQLAFRHEAVVVTVSNISAISGPDPGGFWQITGGLIVGSLFHVHDPDEFEPFSSVTGVLASWSGGYALMPRWADDVVTLRVDAGFADGGASRDAGRDAAAVDSGAVNDLGLDAAFDAGMGDAGADSGADGGGQSDCTDIAGHVVISQVASRGPNGGNDEFVELHNPSGENFDLGGWQLETASVSTPDGGSAQVQWYPRAAVPAGPAVVIPPGGYYLFANKNSQWGYLGDDYDVKYTTGFTEQGAVRIRNASGDVMDTVSFSQPAAEGSAVANPCASGGTCTGSIVRRASFESSPESVMPGGVEWTCGNGLDTGDNAADFVAVAQRFPRNSKSAPSLPECRK